jgi:hypothetical protein
MGRLAAPRYVAQETRGRFAYGSKMRVKCRLRGPSRASHSHFVSASGWPFATDVTGIQAAFHAIPKCEYFRSGMD